MTEAGWNTGWWRGAARAAMLRCPRCGQGRVFRRVFFMRPECSECLLVFDRGDGYWLGAMMFNMAFAMGAVIVVLVAFIVASQPDPNWDLAIALTVAVGLLAPLLFYPFSRTLWMAAERAARLRSGDETE